MEELAPIALAESWDNSGLLTGDPSTKVERVLVALDATSEVIEEAICLKAQMIITHHPLLFRPIKNITTETPLGNKLIRLIQNGISVYAAHTNLDIAQGGTNDILAELAGLTEVELLEETGYQKLKKIAVMVPLLYGEKVREAMCKAGAGYLGKYSDCTFTVKGSGTFMPRQGSKPFIGMQEQMEVVKEAKIETIVPESIVSKVITAMLYAHPYEEAAYDIYPVEQKGPRYGIGRIGVLARAMSLESFARELKQKIGLSSIRVVGDRKKTVKRVALCTGSGIEFLDTAIKKGADVYITGDLKFHDAQRALEAGIAVIDATHYASENCMVPALCEYIRRKAVEQGWILEIVPSQVNGQTFQEIE